MPENETLNPDTRTASRWRPLRDRLDHGESARDVFPDIEADFYGSLRRFRKQSLKRGVTLEELFDAAVNNPEALPNLVRRSGFGDYAQILEDVVASEQGANRECLLRCWLDSVWGSVRDQLQLDHREETFSHGFLDRVNQMLDRLHSGLSQNPSRIPRRPPRKTSPDIDKFLERSLL